jgi:flap endonuclease-1
MGVQLQEFVKARPIEFKSLAGKKIAVDAMNSIYQFLSSIRQPTGEPLKDSRGRVTSHLTGLFYRNVNLLEQGILPVYIFDGKPPELKRAVTKKRTEIRASAHEKWKTALAEGRMEDARTYAQQASKLTSEMLTDSKKLLGHMGIPWIEAPGEGEAQAAHMANTGEVWAAASQDFDSLLFGAPRLVRNLTVSGKRKLPRKNIYVDVKPEIIHLDEVLKALEITREQLVEIGIFIGTDYNPKGISGLGPKKALALIKEQGSAKSALKEKDIEPDFDIDEIKELFLRFETTNDYNLEWDTPDMEKTTGLLCDEHDFSVERVKKGLTRLEEKAIDTKSQKSLDSWFG